MFFFYKHAKNTHTCTHRRTNIHTYKRAHAHTEELTKSNNNNNMFTISNKAGEK